MPQQDEPRGPCPLRPPGCCPAWARPTSRAKGPGPEGGEGHTRSPRGGGRGVCELRGPGTGGEARRPESHTDFWGQHGLGSEQLLQPYHTRAAWAFRRGGWPRPAAARDPGASDWEGSPPDHSSGDLGLVGTTEILQSQTSDLRLGCACGGLWFPTQYWDFCWLLWSHRRLRLLCVSTIIAARGFGVVGRDPSGRASVYCRGCRTPKSC